MQIFAENRRFSQENRRNCRNSQKNTDWRLSPLRFVPLSAGLDADSYIRICVKAQLGCTVIYYRDPLVQTSYSMVLQSSLLSKKGSQRVHMGGIVKALRRSNSPSRGVLVRLAPLFKPFFGKGMRQSTFQ